MKISHYEASKEIRGVLLDDASIVEAVGDNVFPLVADEGTEGDYIYHPATGWIHTGYDQDGSCQKRSVCICLRSECRQPTVAGYSRTGG